MKRSQIIPAVLGAAVLVAAALILYFGPQSIPGRAVEGGPRPAPTDLASSVVPSTPSSSEVAGSETTADQASAGSRPSSAPSRSSVKLQPSQVTPVPGEESDPDSGLKPEWIEGGTYSVNRPYLYNAGSSWAKGDDMLLVKEVICTDSARKEYRIRGIFDLTSHDKATLTIGCSGGKLAGELSRAVDRGNGEFDVTFTLEEPGSPFVSLYPPDGGESFTGQYFKFPE